LQLSSPLTLRFTDDQPVNINKVIVKNLGKKNIWGVGSEKDITHLMYLRQENGKWITENCPDMIVPRHGDFLLIAKQLPCFDQPKLTLTPSVPPELVLLLSSFNIN
jgi:hypothetical protein